MAIVLLGAVACPQPFPREQMLEDLATQEILPANQMLVERADALGRSIAALRTEPGEESLEEARRAWRSAASAWERARLYRFDRMIVVHSQVSKRPADTEFIESTIADPPAALDVSFVGSVGSLSKGLAAIEYLLFDEDSVRGLRGVDGFVEPNRLDYLEAATEDLRRVSRLVRDRWLPEGEDYRVTFVVGEGGLDGFRRSLGKLLNRIVAVLEQAVRDDLGRPLGTGGGAAANPELVEAKRSASSLGLLRQRLQGIERVFFAIANEGASAVDEEAATRYRLADLIDHLGLEFEGRPFGAVLAERFEAVERALAAVPEPLADAVVEQPDRVETAYDELRELLVLVKVDLANQLGITVTFNDNDGD